MNEQVQEDADKPVCGWARLYTKSGVLVTLPIPEKPMDYAAMAANVESALAAGFAVHAPGLEAGEEKEMVGYVVRGQQDNGREVTDFILIYANDDARKFSTLKIYLNRDEDVAAFEAASGMKLDQIPVYVGQDKPERGKNKMVDKFIIQVRKPFPVVFKQNPKWTQEAADAAKSRNEMYTVPRRVFVRWADAPQAAPAGDGISEKEAATMAEIMMKLNIPPVNIGKFIVWLGGSHKTPATLNDLVNIPKGKYQQGLQHLQKLEQEFDRKAAGQ